MVDRVPESPSILCGDDNIRWQLVFVSQAHFEASLPVENLKSILYQLYDYYNTDIFITS